MTTWTKQHDIDLVVAYLGYEIQTCGKLTVCIDGDGKTHKIPDMRARNHGWLFDCLDSWLRVRKEYRSARVDTRVVRLLDWQYPSIPQGSGEGDNMREALAWALWRAR